MQFGSKQKFMKFVILLQKKTPKVISFECRNAHSNLPIYNHELVKSLLKIAFLYINLVILTFINFQSLVYLFLGT